MTATLRHVQVNEPFRPTARVWNAFVDAALAFRRGPAVGHGAEALAPARMLHLRLPVKNNSGYDRDRFDVLGLSTGPLFDPATALDGFKNALALIGDEPDEPVDIGRFCVLAEPIADGAIGWGIVAGLAPVLLDVEDEDAAEYADCADGITGYLAAGATGSARVLWRAGGEGQQWAYVLLGAGLPLVPSDTEYHVLQTQAAGEVLRVVWDFARLHDD